MLSRKLYTLSLCLFFLNVSFAQTPPCGYDLVQQQLMEDNPEYRAEVQEYIRETLPRIPQQTNNNQRSVITIPVVVHIIHTGQNVGNGANLSVERILSQIEVLNEDYSRSNEDADETPIEYQGIAADVEIQFCLASTDPGDGVTNGITRHVYSNVPDINYIENTIKPETTWDSNRYLNIWTIEMPSNTVLGYSYLPTPTIVGFPKDGVVIDYPNFGYVDAGIIGRTCVHEVGHYLGLQHPWGESDSNGDPIGCSSDDGVDDTPNCSGPHFGCPNFGLTSCGNTDMIMNYMEYVNDDCMNLFTEGQKSIMQATLNGPRSILSSSALSACEVVDLSCQNLANESIDMGFESGQSNNGWIVENSNNDTRTWSMTQASTSNWGPNTGSGLAVYLWNVNLTTPADDYLFTPCFEVLNNHTYKVSFSYACASDNSNVVYTERLEVGLSEQQNSSDFNVPNSNWNFEVNNAYPNYDDKSFTFQPGANGFMSIGFHAKSEANKFALQIDDIRVEDLGTSSPVAELKESNTILMTPNPTEGVVTLSLDFENPQKSVQIQIYDVLGRLVQQKFLSNIRSEQTIFNLTDFDDGIYFVNVKGEEVMLTERIILRK